MPLLQVYGDGLRAASSFAASTLFVRLRDGVGNAVTQQEQYNALALSASMQLVSDPATSVPVALAFSKQDQALIGSYMPVQPGVYSMVRPQMCVGSRVQDPGLELDRLPIFAKQPCSELRIPHACPASCAMGTHLIPLLHQLRSW